MKLKLYSSKNLSSLPLPLFSSAVQAGFPSPADDHTENPLDLNELIIQHPAATFFLKVEGNSMENAQISSGDLLVVDRTLTPQDGQIVVAILDGEFTVKRVKIAGSRLFLCPENSSFSPIEVSEENDFQVWGVVTFVIHKCLR